MTDDPITGVCIVADKSNCPSGYQVIETTTDNQDADLWKDKLLRKRVTRYLCYTKKTDSGTGDDVLVDLMVIKETENIPAGYTCIPTTYDSNEPVLKKKLLVIQLFKRISTEKAISEIYLTSSKTKTKPVEVSARGDINGINLFLRMASVKAVTLTTTVTEAVTPVRKAPIPAPRQNLPQPAQSTGLPEQSSAPQLPYSWENARLTRQSTLRSSRSVTSDDILSAIEGVPFQINPVLQVMHSETSYDVPHVAYKSRDDIERQYYYDFQFEIQTKQRLTMCDSP